MNRKKEVFLMKRRFFFNFFIFFAGLFLVSFSNPKNQKQPFYNAEKDGKAPESVSFSAYPHLTSTIKKAIAPYLISDLHPLKQELDDLFGKERITRNRAAFMKSGFEILDEGIRSFIVVARHPLLPNHLVKCYLDTEKREKWNQPSWSWLVNRCEGATKIRNIIEEYGIKHFDVARKWIYVLPLLESSMPFKSCYTRHPALILVTDMHLVPEKENLYAWENFVTFETLNELYLIITLAKGSSYRPDNIAYSYSGKFCFIDCEYPSRGPDYKRITKYLNPKMQAYWNYLVKNGLKGKHFKVGPKNAKTQKALKSRHVDFADTP